MFNRVIPSWEQIKQFKQPLTEGELFLLKFLDDNLKRDTSCQTNDLTLYNGWLIFVQPYLNGSRPDIVILNPCVGVQIFEVKDWNFGSYIASRGSYNKKSPIRQVEYYKEKIYSQLIPHIGESIDNDTNYYTVIKTAVYFHKFTTLQAQEAFKAQVKDTSKFPIIGYDSLLKDKLFAVVPDSFMHQSKYWQKDWNKELLFWLNPPFHSIDQGIAIPLTTDQKKFSEPTPGHYRVRGVAGSGKTQVLAYRASKLASQGYRVLVLTFNLTLCHVIRDMVQRSPFDFSWSNVTITYFHGFCKDILNEFDEKWPRDEADVEDIFRELVPKKVLEVIYEKEYVKYDAILIDEGQDFYVEWYIMLCHFLTTRDEVVVVCDKKQNIYGRKTEWLDKRRSGVENFDDKWIELKKIIRLPEQIAKISIQFGRDFNLNQEIKVGKIERRELFNQFHDHVVWWNIKDNWIDKVDEAFEIIKNQATYKHPSDIAILLPNIYFGFTCIKHFESKNIGVNHVFEDEDEKKYHPHKKAFRMGDSRLKMSTIHSFKGWEVPNVILIIPSSIYGDEELHDNAVYTAITRAKENLIIINANERYREFGKSISDEWIE